jgi:hypothetical protein
LCNAAIKIPASRVSAQPQSECIIKVILTANEKRLLQFHGLFTF